jgi:hypothetical protein
MSTGAVFTKGTQIQIETAAGVYTTICDVIQFTGPTIKNEIRDVTDLCSTAREKKADPLADPGDITLDIQWIPDNAMHALLRAKAKAATITGFRMVFPDDDSTTFTFNGTVTSFPVSGSVGDVLKGSVTITVTGDITES